MTTTWQDAAGALSDYFVTQWTSLAPSVRIARRNGPDLVPPPDQISETWIRYGFLTGFSRHVSVGVRRARDFGRFEVQIFTPLGKGDGRSRSYADLVRQIMDSAALSAALPTISLGAPEFVPGGKDPVSPFWMDLVSTPVQSDHLP